MGDGRAKVVSEEAKMPVDGVALDLVVLDAMFVALTLAIMVQISRVVSYGYVSLWCGGWVGG